MNRKDSWIAVIAAVLGVSVVGTVGSLLFDDAGVSGDVSGRLMPETGSMGVVILGVIVAVFVIAGIVMNVVSSHKAKKELAKPTVEEAEDGKEDPLVSVVDASPASEAEAAAKAVKDEPAPDGGEPAVVTPTASLKPQEPAEDGVEPPTLVETHVESAKPVEATAKPVEEPSKPAVNPADAPQTPVKPVKQAYPDKPAASKTFQKPPIATQPKPVEKPAGKPAETSTPTPKTEAAPGHTDRKTADKPNGAPADKPAKE